MKLVVEVKLTVVKVEAFVTLKRLYSRPAQQTDTVEIVAFNELGTIPVISSHCIHISISVNETADYTTTSLGGQLNFSERFLVTQTINLYKVC
jgi:hypothetical protein